MTMTASTFRAPLRDRLFRKLVIQSDGCVVWTGAKTKAGYGTMRGDPPESKHTGVHRVMWELHEGPVPDGLTLDHLCRNKLCVNLLHLEPVPMRENILRSDGPAVRNARKTHCPKGHLLDGRNKHGERYCLTCNRARCLAYYYAKKEKS